MSQVTEKTIDEMEEAVYETIKRNDHLFSDDDEHRIMIDVTRGLLSLYDGNIDGVSSGPNIIIADFPLRWTVQGMAHLYEKGINAVVPSQGNSPARLLEPKVKNRSRIHYLMANIEVAQMSGQDNWALLLDEDGFITEGTGDNFFIVKDGVLSSPNLDSCLDGITRRTIIELAEELNIPFQVKQLTVQDVLDADESFFSGTAAEVVPINSLDDQSIGTGLRGPITENLQQTYFDQVRGERDLNSPWLTFTN